MEFKSEQLLVCGVENKSMHCPLTIQIHQQRWRVDVRQPVTE